MLVSVAGSGGLIGCGWSGCDLVSCCWSGCGG